MSGGAWKSSHYLRDFFKEDILKSFPDAQVIRPLFEPLVGSVICRHKEAIAFTELIEILKVKFNEYFL